MDAVSLVVGVLSIFLWPIPYAGFLSSMTGLVTGIIASRHHKSGMANAGIVVSGLGLLITLVNLKFSLIDILLRKYFQY